MNHFLNCLRMGRRISTLLLGLVIPFAWMGATLNGWAQEAPSHERFSSAQELYDAANLILSDKIEYNQRVQTAHRLVVWLANAGSQEQKNFARQLSLRFYSSLVSDLKPADIPSTPPPLPEALQAIAEEIHQGKYQSAAESIRRYVQDASNQSLHPAVTVLALKAMRDLEGFHAFFAELSRKSVTGYSLYFLGTLHARDTHFVEAETFFRQALEAIQAPVFRHWLAIDLVKLLMRKGDFEAAGQQIDKLLKNNPKDPYALYWRARYLHEQGQNDAARQELFRLRPLLHADPHLVSGVAGLAYRMNEAETAMQIMEKFENQIEPNSQFYQTMAYLLDRVKNQPQLAEAYQSKARQIEDTRVQVGLPPTQELQALLNQARENRLKNLAGMEGLDPFNRIYIALLDENVPAAVRELKLLSEKPGAGPLEFYLLGMVYRRSGQIYNALESFVALRQKFPEFQPAKTLAHAADLAVRTGKPNLAQNFYAALQNRFPESTQAQVAKRYFNQKEQESSYVINPIQVSPLFSRYPTYAAPFVLSEVVQYWGDSQFGGGLASFASIRRQLGLSKFRGLRFDQFLVALQLGTSRYKIEPFIGVEEVVLEYLKQRIPVIFIQSELYAEQNIIDLQLITGADPGRGVFYAEGVTTYDTRLLTESELLEGVCLGVYPESGNEAFSPRAEQAQQAGAKFVQLNPAEFRRRAGGQQIQLSQYREEIMKAEDKLFVPHQLAYNHWIRQNESTAEARRHLNTIQKNSSHTALYWFLNALISFKDDKMDEGLLFLERAIQKQPSNMIFKLAKVRALRNAEQYNEAVAMAENLRYSYPEDALVSFELLALYKRFDRFQDYNQEESRIQKLFGNDLHFEIETDSPKAVSQNFFPPPG